MTPEKITELFNRFVGKVLLDPERATCNMDPVVSDMDSLAVACNVHVNINFPNADSFFAPPSPCVQVAVKKIAEGYRVEGVSFG